MDASSPTLKDLEQYPTERIKGLLDLLEVSYTPSYDRWDLFSLAAASLRFDCPGYTKEQREAIKRGETIVLEETEEPPVLSILFPPQRADVDKLVSIYKRHDSGLEMSETGSGKTLKALAVGYLLHKNMYIVTQANILNSWQDRIKGGNVENVIALNSYTLAIKAKEYDAYGDLKYTRPSPYIVRRKTTQQGRKRDEISWQGLSNTLFIFDEVHTAKNSTSLAYDLLVGCYDYIKREPNKGNLLLLVGATPLDKPKNVTYILYVLGLIELPNKYAATRYLKTITLEPSLERKKVATKPKKPKTKKSVAQAELEEHNDAFLKINRVLYDPKDPRAVKITKADIEQYLRISHPVSITIQAYNMSTDAERIIEEQNQVIAGLLVPIRGKVVSTKLGEITTALQIIELQKVVTVVNLAIDALNRGRSVIIFVQYHSTSNAIAEQLAVYEPRLLIGRPTQGMTAIPASVRKWAAVTKAKRHQYAEEYQRGLFPLIIVHTAVGGTGISLHDIVGGHPRTVIVLPMWGGITFVQVVGRADRLCKMSDVEQIVVYAKSNDPDKPGWDVRLAEVMRKKLQNIKELDIGQAATDFMRELYKQAEEGKQLDTTITNIRVDIAQVERNIPDLPLEED